MSGTKRLLLLHPLLLAAYPILFLYSRNMGEFPLGVVAVPLVKAILLTAAGLAVARVVAQGWLRAGLVVSVFLLVFYSYGRIMKLMYRLPLPFSLYDLPFKAHTILFPGLGLFFACIAAIILRAKRTLETPTRIMNAVAVLLVAITLLEIAFYKVRTREAEFDQFDHAIFGPVRTDIGPPSELPDIYYIILDAYPREDNLLELYGHDNRPFIDFLRSRGFFVADSAHANYSRTIFSLASELNFAYLDTLASLAGGGQTNLRPVRHLLEESRARDLLVRLGYRFVSIRSGFQNTELKGADLYLTQGQRGEFESALLRTTAASPVSAWLSRTSSTVAGAHREKDRQRIRYAFEMMPGIASEEGPVFVFAHIIAPHPPFVFDRQGGDVEADRYYDFKSSSHLINPEGLTRSEYRDQFLDQLLYINGMVASLIDSLISDARVSPIILLRGDHGPGTFSHHSRFDCTYLGDRLSILYALRLPCPAGGLLEDTITPVNTFRIIFDSCFGASLPLLEERNFYMSFEDPYRFIEVTGQIGGRDDMRRLERLDDVDYYPER